MSKNNEFANMPFGELSRQMVVPQKTIGPAQPALPKQKKDVAIEDDSFLFLQAVENVIEKPVGKKYSDRCSAKEQLFRNNPKFVKNSKSVENSDKMEEMNPKPSAPEKMPPDCDDDNLFLANVSDVKPLNACGREVPLKPETTVRANLSDDDFNLAAGKFEFSLLFSEEYFEGHVQGLDPVVFDKLRAGTFSPEAHIDFHGLNAIQAFESLRGFVKNAWYKGLRTILVIHGRGRNSPNGVGVLREKLQTWLTQDPFKRVVLAFCTAQPHDGGPGSIYLLLRKRKKKGKIYWEKMPLDSDLYDA